MFITSAKEEMLLSALVCSLEGLCKTTRPIFTKFGGKVMTYRSWKKPLDFMWEFRLC